MAVRLWFMAWDAAVQQSLCGVCFVNARSPGYCGGGDQKAHCFFLFSRPRLFSRRIKCATIISLFFFHTADVCTIRN